MEIDKLIKLCIKQDRKSQKEFYLLTCDRLMNISRRYTSSIDDAKDVLQNAYLQIFKCMSQFDFRKGTLDNWLARIVVNEALQQFRKKEKSKKITENSFSNDRIDPPNVLEKLAYEDLLKIVDLLPDGYKMVFNLHVIEGYSHKEIAGMLDISESTSRSQLTRARQFLQSIFIRYQKPELC